MTLRPRKQRRASFYFRLGRYIETGGTGWGQLIPIVLALMLMASLWLAPQLVSVIPFVR